MRYSNSRLILDSTLTHKYKEQNGQIRIEEKIKKPEFTLTPIKTGEKTGLQKIAKVGTRRESPLSDDVVGTATSGTTTTPLDMLEATVKVTKTRTKEPSPPKLLHPYQDHTGKISSNPTAVLRTCLPPEVTWQTSRRH